MTRILLSLIALTMLASCSSVQTPVRGFLYTDSKAAVMATDQRLATSKKGEACVEGILGIVRGDASITTAAKQGKIKNITHIDHTAKSILGIYTEYCTVVYGR